MARKVFFSFKYDDVFRAMNVRNSNVISSDTKTGFIDKADFEKVKRQGDAAIKNWIDDQLKSTSVTVILVGANTNKSKWVKYEIDASIARGNGILTIDISKISNMQGETTDCCGMTVKGYSNYLWNSNRGRDNMGRWIEDAAKAAVKF